MQTAQSETGQAYVPRPRVPFSCVALLAFLEERGDRGATLTDMYRHFGDNCSAAQLHAALLMLRDAVKTTVHRAQGPNRRAKKPSTFYSIGGKSADPAAEEKAARRHGTDSEATGIVWKRVPPKPRPRCLPPAKRGASDLETLRAFLTERGSAGASRTELHAFLGRNRSAKHLDTLLADLSVSARFQTTQGARKPTTVIALRSREAAPRK